MTPKLHVQILTALGDRPDIWMDKSESDGNGEPEILGTRLIRFIETETRGATSYHPFQYSGYKYVGQSFAIETNLSSGKAPLSKKQTEWRDAFEAAGGLYVEARTMDDVYEALGKTRPEPWAAYETRDVRVK